MQLTGVKYIALTFDYWTSVSQHPYIAITSHTIDEIGIWFPAV